MRKSAIFTVIILGTILLFVQCKRNQDDDVEVDVDLNFATNEVLVEQTFSTVDNIADQVEYAPTVTKSTANGSQLISACASIARDTVSGLNEDTVTTTVDFGNFDCGTLEGDTIKGIIKIVKIYDTSGQIKVLKTKKVGTSDLFINGHEISSAKEYSIIETELNSYKLSASETIKFKKGGQVSRSIDRKFVKTGGQTTLLDWSDDVYEITGTTSGTQYNGKTYTTVITDALVKGNGCLYIESGIIEVSVSGEPKITIDYGYGTGQCDNDAKAVSGGKTFELKL